MAYQPSNKSIDDIMAGNPFEPSSQSSSSAPTTVLERVTPDGDTAAPDGGADATAGAQPADSAGVAAGRNVNFDDDDFFSDAEGDFFDEGYVDPDVDPAENDDEESDTTKPWVLWAAIGGAIALAILGIFAALGGFRTADDDPANAEALSAPSTSYSPDDIIAREGGATAAVRDANERPRLTPTVSSSASPSATARPTPRVTSGNDGVNRNYQTRQAEPAPQNQPAPQQRSGGQARPVQPAPAPAAVQPTPQPEPAPVVAQKPVVEEEVTIAPEVSTVYQAPDRN